MYKRRVNKKKTSIKKSNNKEEKMMMKSCVCINKTKQKTVRIIRQLRWWEQVVETKKSKERKKKTKILISFYSDVILSI